MGRMVIEQTFGTLKNRWCILKAFNMSVEKTTLVTLACAFFIIIMKFTTSVFLFMQTSNSIVIYMLDSMWE